MPPNPDIAKTFFRAGYIEIWGRGTVNMAEYCRQAGVPEPIFEDKWGGVAVIFVRNEGMRPWESADGRTQENSAKDLEKVLKGNERKIFLAIKNRPRITNKELSEITSLSISDKHHK